MKFSKHLLLSCSLLFMLVSCSVQQRRYRPGVAVTLHHNVNHFKESKKQVSKSDVGTSVLSQTAESPLVVAETTLTAPQSVGKNETRHYTGRFKPVKAILKDSCDIIIFRDGSQVSAMVLNEGSNEVRYRRCDNISGPVFVTPVSELLMIKYTDGRRKVYEEKPQQKSMNKEQRTYTDGSGIPVSHPKAGLALILCILGILTSWLLIGFLLIAISLGFSAVVLKDDKASPGKYKNVALARIAMVINLVFLGLVLVLIIYGLFMLWTI